MNKITTKKMIATFGKRAVSLRSGMIYGLFALMIAVALVSGVTSAWFTAGDTLENTLTAGTVDIEADGPYGIDGQLITKDVVFDPYCASLSYTINNRGTKRSYVRVKFDGHWERTFHQNTATVTAANYTVTDADSAHFNYGPNNQKEYSTVNPNTLGFTDFELIGPTSFAPLPAQSGSVGSGYQLSGSASIGAHSLDAGSGTGTGSVTATGEVFRVGIGDSNYQIRDPERLQIIGLFGPSGLLLSGEVKGNNTPRTFTFTEDGLIITITDNVSSFDFVSNYPIYHVYVKGGNAGHHLYTYYIDRDKIILAADGRSYVNVPATVTIPFEGINASNRKLFVNPLNLSADGVYQGTGLQQIGGGWSHARFLYKVPQPQPGIELIKLVSVDGGATWFTARHPDPASGYNRVLDLLAGRYGYSLRYYNYADRASWPVVQAGVAPRFQIIAANTGNVPLSGVNITDDYFANLNFNNLTLNPGQLWFSPAIIYSEYLSPLPVDLVSVKLQEPFTGWDPALWTPRGPLSLGQYFYHTQIIPSGASVPLHVKICLDQALINRKYSGAVFRLYAYFEAVQTTNRLVNLNWPGNPYNIP